MLELNLTKENSIFMHTQKQLIKIYYKIIVYLSDLENVSL